jgi:SAM-dependent methyltransferase
MKTLPQERRKYLQHKHTLHDYHFDAIAALLCETSLHGKRVLEIGGSNMPRELLFEDFQVDQWVSVDLVDATHYARVQQVDHYRQEQIHPLADAENYLFRDRYTIFNGAAENIGESFGGKFDIAVSIAAFEHIGRLPTVLRKIYQALKPGGILFSYFGPIYSCRVGHHCWAAADLNFNNPGALPEFCHLLMNPAELLTHLLPHYPRETAEEAVYQIYHSERINRNLFEDYQQYMLVSPFEQFECRPYGIQAVDARTQKQLEELRPGYARFDAYGMQITARKLANMRSM